MSLWSVPTSFSLFFERSDLSVYLLTHWCSFVESACRKMGQKASLFTDCGVELVCATRAAPGPHRAAQSRFRSPENWSGWLFDHRSHLPLSRRWQKTPPERPCQQQNVLISSETDKSAYMNTFSSDLSPLIRQCSKNLYPVVLAVNVVLHRRTVSSSSLLRPHHPLVSK